MKKKKKKDPRRKRSGTESFVTFQIFRTKFSFLHYGPDRTKITYNNERTPFLLWISTSLEKKLLTPIPLSFYKILSSQINSREFQL